MAFSSMSDLWNKWNIRSFVLLSLLLQVFLILFSPIRKKTANDHIIFLLWLAYLMADLVAAFAIGLISHSQGNLCAHATNVDGALQAFWASFLLLHLGGPDTITAFSLEDNSLWRRHLFSLIFQIGAAIYVFVQIFPSDRSLIIPTMLVFLVGVIKNAERTLALKLSSLPRLREWVLTQRRSAMIMHDNHVRTLRFECVYNEEDEANEYSAKDEAKNDESAVVELAYLFFQIFKIFLGDLMFTREERQLSCGYFARISPMDALRVISVELQFIYEVLHTKVLAIRSKLSYIFRFVTFMGVVVAFVLFNRLKKHQLSKLDVKITYILLFGAIVLDVIALFMLFFSDWTVVKIMCNNSRSSRSCSLLKKMAYNTYKLREPQSATCEAEPNADVTYEALDTPLIFRRWLESISACNLLSMSMKESPRRMYKRDRSLGSIASSYLFDFPFHMAEKIISYFHQAGETITKGCGLWTTKEEIVMIANTKYVSKNPFLKKLWIFIFKEVRRKSSIMQKLRERMNDTNTISKARHDELIEVTKISEARGDLFLKSLSDENNYDDLQEDVTVANYDDSIITWHIATEIWYNKEESMEKKEEREFSKILSDYMLYLLLNQSNVMSTVAGIAQITAAETLKDLLFYYNHGTKNVEELCEQLFENYSTMLKLERPATSMLWQGIRLAGKMERLGDMKWVVMSGVWVEMLSYAAIHIDGEAHVQVLSKGGELLAFTWLLMAHFGCVYKAELGICYERERVW